MKVAIIGAGISGMACALALEKRGIKPDIFEQFDRCGGMVPFATCILQIIQRPVKDPLAILRTVYGVDVTPLHPLKRIIRFGSRKRSSSSANLGQVFELGPNPRSINSELYSKLSTRVQFNTVADFKQLSSLYDKVVIATGSPYVAKELGCWSDILRAWVRGAVIEGNFDPTTWLVWYDKTYSNSGYVYLGPFDNETASVVMVVSDIKEHEVEPQWRKFLDGEKISNPVKQEFIREHVIGFCHPREVDNIMLIGNSGGFMESIFGFGLYNGIISGVLAAEAIYERSSYEEKVSFLDKRLYECYLLRRKLTPFTNEDYNNFVGMGNVVPIDWMIYRTNLDFIGLHAKMTQKYYQ